MTKHSNQACILLNFFQAVRLRSLIWFSNSLLLIIRLDWAWLALTSTLSSREGAFYYQNLLEHCKEVIKNSSCFNL